MSTSKNVESFTELFNLAVEARHAGDLNQAKSLCERALHEVDDSNRKHVTVAHGELGYINLSLGDPTLAAWHYKQAIGASPTSELASLGLFHSLSQSGHWEDALHEIVRFVGAKDSVGYRTLLADGFDIDLPPRIRTLADHARNLLDSHKGS